VLAVRLPRRGASTGILRNTSLLAVARLAQRASSILLAVFIARSLGASGLGIYSAALAYYALLGPAGELGIVNLLVREISKDHRKTNRFLVHGCTISAAAAMVAIGAMWGVLALIHMNGDLRRALQIVVLALLPGTLNSVQEAVFVAHQRVHYQTVVTLVGSLLTLGLSIYLLETGHGLISLFVVFVAVEYAATVAYFVIINRRIQRLRWEFDRTFTRWFIREGAPFAGTSILAALFARPEIILLSALGGAATVGYYSAALKIAVLWNDVPQIFMTNVFPVLSRSYRTAPAAFDRLRKQSLAILLGLSIPLCVGILVLAPQLAEIVFGSGFEETVTPMRVLALSIPLVSLQAVLWRILSVRDAQSIVFRVQLVCVGVRLGLGYALIVAFGTVGAAASVTATLALHSALLGFFVRRGGINLELGRLVAGFTAAAAAMGVLTWALVHEVGVWAGVVGGIGSYALFLLVGYRLTRSAGVLRLGT
jgi:O-antigen/teichoic acid export membrane protein